MSERPDNIVPITRDARSAAEKFGAEHDRELLTILFTDLVDSTKLQSDLGNVEAARLVELHREIVREELAKYDAREIEWAGDSCLAVFTKPSDGVVFALKLQASLREARASEPKMPLVRIGLHLGEIVVRHNTDAHKDDLFGLQVSEAARVMSLARGDQVYCTRSVFDNARGSLKGQSLEGLGEVEWLRHGFFELKGSDELVEVGEVGEIGFAPLCAPEANDKCRPFKGDPEKWRKRRERGGVTSRGIPAWSLAAVAVVAIGLGLLVGRGTSTSPAPNLAVDAPIRSLAVLPFDNLMGDETKEYFVDGMTDTLTAELSKIGSIKVIARTSAMKFKNSDESLSDIARQLGVDGLIEGSVQQFGDEIRITAQLIHGASEEHLWADNFEGTLAGVMKMQGEVAVAIADQIGAVLTPDEREDYASAKDVDPEAYDLYLQGRSVMQGRTEQDLSSALALFDRALEIDAEMALVHAGISGVHSLRASYLIGSMEEARENALGHAYKAIELDASLAEAHTALGESLLQLDQDKSWSQATQAAQRALELNPGLSRARYIYGYLLLRLGRISEGLEQMRLGVELAPLDPIVLAGLGDAFAGSGRYGEAEDAYLRAVELNPELLYPQMRYQDFLWRFGRLEEGLESLQKLADSTGNSQARKVLERTNAALQGIEAVRTLVAEQEPNEAEEFQYGPLFASLPFAIGDVDMTLKHLEAGMSTPGQGAITIRSYAWIHSLEPDPKDWRHLDDDPRFWAMLDKYNLPPLPPEHPRYAKEQAYLRQKAAEAALAAQPKPIRRYAIDLGTEYPLAPESGFRDEVLAASPDGARIVYVSAGVDLDSGLAVRERDRLEVRPISGTSGASHPFFSPDGTRVGFYADNEWRWIPVDGGPATKIKDASFPTGAAWADDGTIVIGGGLSEGLQRYSDSGERLEELTTVAADVGDAVHAMPHPLPNGKGILYTVSSTPGIEGTRVEALSFKTGEITVVARQAGIPSYAESGHILYVTSGALMAVPFSIDSFAVTGSPVRVSELYLASDISIPSAYAIARDGTLWYGTEGESGGLVQFTWLDFDGVEHPTAAKPRPRAPIPSLSPDGTKLAVDDGRNIYTIDLVGGVTNRLTFGEFTERWPMWGPNGEEIYYASYGSSMGLMKRRANGMGTPEQVTASMGSFVPRIWSPDGSQILGLQLTTDASMDIGVLTLGEPATLETLIGGPGQQSNPALSPDGKWLAYESNESGASQVYVRPYPSLDGKWQVSEDGGMNPQWAPDGSKLYYIVDGTALAVPVKLEPTFAFQRAEAVVEHPQLSFIMSPLLSPDGTRFLLQKPIRSESASRKMIVVENFFEVLNRIAPHPDAN